ncbi:hypothetical protein [Bacillus sp. FJAT-29937]|uniref:hypothetical protein n=1 Tax=Bacillus sp. FJAT-29937 TaxID=1720553 RepID=UPI00082A47B0|nr:hypothetical protein [Bacillus sp. FJAT-29937]
MKTTDFAIIFIIIVLPLLVFSQWRSEDTNAFAKLNHQYEGAMTIASHDAIDQLRLNVKPNQEAGYDSMKFNRVNPEPAFDTFIHSLALNFDVKDEVTKDLMARYVPVFAILDYDGALLNVYQEIINGEGHKELKRVWLPKIPFSYHDNEGNVISFTLDDYVMVYDADIKEWVKGKREWIKNDVTIPLLHDPVQFNQIRRDTIVNTFQNELAYYINEHNVYTKQLGITYKFTLPLIPQEDWYNTIDDISIFTFFQGYPYERGEGTFNQYALAGSRLFKADVIHAAIVDGQKIFFNKSCGFPYVVEEIYPNKKEAARAGYTEKSCLNVR